jgi:hypothetical protein
LLGRKVEGLEAKVAPARLRQAAVAAALQDAPDAPVKAFARAVARRAMAVRIWKVRLLSALGACSDHWLVTKTKEASSVDFLLQQRPFLVSFGAGLRPISGRGG